jgi:alkylation response protein AidB-like acyl-CoA dehydrogenase
MDLRFSPAEEALRTELRAFLETSLSGDFARLRGRGGPGDERAMFAERRAWERHLAISGWTGAAWPTEHGGRGLTLEQQVVFHEEYARARAPGRLGHIGETLAGPTLIEFGSPSQQRRFLPPILSGEELWCQGYSEPDAGSDLAGLSTTAELDGDEWVVHGAKVWISLAHWSDWCFVLARTEPKDPDRPRHRGISYLLVPMRQAGVEIRPIVQLTGSSEFSEVVFDGARTATGNLVGTAGDGWRVAMGTLGIERGTSTLGQVLQFENELDMIVSAARRRGLSRDPIVRQGIAQVWSRLRIMRWNALRILSNGVEQGAATITKLHWSCLHRDMGELAVAVLGVQGSLDGAESDELRSLQRLFLFSRADTIYAGTSEIQRNIIGERALGLPKEPS